MRASVDADQGDGRGLDAIAWLALPAEFGHCEHGGPVAFHLTGAKLESVQDHAAV